MILAEQLMLLSLDPERGSFAPGITATRLRRAAAAALLLDLLLAQRIVPRNGGLIAIDAMPSFHPLLTDALRAVHRLGGGGSAEAAVAAVEHGIGSLLRRILRNLADRDLLHEQRHRLVLRRWPVRSMQALSEVFDRVHEALGPQGGTMAMLLLGLANAAEVLPARLTADERARASLKLAQPLALDPPFDDGHRRLARALLDAARLRP